MTLFQFVWLTLAVAGVIAFVYWLGYESGYKDCEDYNQEELDFLEAELEDARDDIAQLEQFIQLTPVNFTVRR